MAKILIIDDSLEQRQDLRQVLEGSGYQVIEAVDGLDGLSQVKANPDLDLVVCDVNMPNLDGVSMCQKLRDLHTWRGQPIFMLTTETKAELKAAGKAAGVVNWIVKPLRPKPFLSVLGKTLNAAKAS